MQCIHLTSAGENQRRTEDGSKIKLTYGRRRGGSIRLPGLDQLPAPVSRRARNRVQRLGTGYPTGILLGGLAAATPPRGRLIIALQDDDAAGSKGAPAFAKTLRQWREDGIKIEAATHGPSRAAINRISMMCYARAARGRDRGGQRPHSPGRAGELRPQAGRPALRRAIGFARGHLHRHEPDRDRVVRTEAEFFGRKVLVITHLEQEHAFTGIPSVRTLHHGNLVGDDDFGDVDLIISIGDRSRRPDEIARLASAEAGRLIKPARPTATSCRALMADGSGVEFERLAYADPTMQAVHASIYDQSFLQGALGRGRGLRRTAEDPLEIRVFGNVPLPVPLTSLTRWHRPSRIEKMLLAGVVPLTAIGMSRFFPDLFRRGKPAMARTTPPSRRFAAGAAARHCVPRCAGFA